MLLFDQRIAVGREGIVMLSSAVGSWWSCLLIFLTLLQYFVFVLTDGVARPGKQTTEEEFLRCQYPLETMQRVSKCLLDLEAPDENTKNARKIQL